MKRKNKGEKMTVTRVRMKEEEDKRGNEREGKGGWRRESRGGGGGGREAAGIHGTLMQADQKGLLTKKQPTGSDRRSGLARG